jgi:hypothetical protein
MCAPFAGRVLKVDGAHVAVRFPCSKDCKEMKDLTSDDTVSLLQDCRLMRKDELQVSKFFLSRCVVSMEDVSIYVWGKRRQLVIFGEV